MKFWVLFIHLMNDPWKAVKSTLSQWKCRSHLEMPSVPSVLCISAGEMEYLISLFSMGLFILYNEGKFINTIFSFQKKWYLVWLFHTLYLYLISFSSLSNYSSSPLTGEILAPSYCNSSDLLKATQSLKAIAVTNRFLQTDLPNANNQIKDISASWNFKNI